MAASIPRQMVREVRRVAITGGTHGNELSGVALARHFIANPQTVAKPSFETICMLTNLNAIEANRRYVDTDLNRCFALKALKQEVGPNQPKEVQRAQELNTQLGPKGSSSPNVDFIFDLHNTTANTGVLLCFHPEDKLANEVAAHAQQLNPEVRLNHWLPDDDGDVPFLPSIAPSGMTVEVGAVAHSTVKSTVVHQMANLLEHCLSYLELRNVALANADANGDESSVKRQLVETTVSNRVVMVDYPRHENGDLAAFIHPDLQGIQELAPESAIKPGDNLFLKLDGSVIKFDPSTYGLTSEQIENGIYPMFVNEAAYYEKGIALMLTKQTKHVVGVVSPSQ